MAKIVKKKESAPQKHPCHKSEIVRLNRVRGQVEGAVRMIEGGSYCPNIITQLRAARQALATIEASVLETHLHHCVHDAFLSKDKMEIKTKVSEIVSMFYKMKKKV